MKMKITLLFLLWILAGPAMQAQNLVLSGQITFERKENMHKLFKDDNSWNEERMKYMPKYKTDYFTLQFNTSKSLYKILQEDENPAFQWMKVAHANTVQLDLDAKQMHAEKTVYEGEYLIEDSVPMIDWKLLGEYRDISGYSCRKASAILFDSIYVLAFYTDQIPVTTGPESFTGLPGMILGVVIPRMNLTWFATKVESAFIQEQQLLLKPNKKKKLSQQVFAKQVQTAFSDWGTYGAMFFLRARL